MNATGIAVIAVSSDYAATVAAGTYIAHRVIDRLRVTAPPRPAPASSPPSPPALEAPPGPVTTAEAAQRREKFASLRGEGIPVPDAAAALRIAPRTARRYEAERRLRERGAA